MYRPQPQLAELYKRRCIEAYVSLSQYGCMAGCPAQSVTDRFMTSVYHIPRSVRCRPILHDAARHALTDRYKAIQTIECVSEFFSVKT